MLLAAGSTWAAPTADALVERSQLSKRAVIGTTMRAEWIDNSSPNAMIPLRTGNPNWISPQSGADDANSISAEACAAWCESDNSCGFAVWFHAENTNVGGSGTGHYCDRYKDYVEQSDANEPGTSGWLFTDVQTFSRGGPVPDGWALTGKLYSVLMQVNQKPASALGTFEDCRKLCLLYKQFYPNQPRCRTFAWGREPNGEQLYFCDIYSVRYKPNRNGLYTKSDTEIYLRVTHRTEPQYYGMP